MEIRKKLSLVKNTSVLSMFFPMASRIKELFLSENVKDKLESTLGLFIAPIIIPISVSVVFILGTILGVIKMDSILTFWIKFYYNGQLFDIMSWRYHLCWLFISGFISITD
jgi:hypothetical protein